ncbi:CLUMA_CG004761, isoform A [Clunio marinus]|uniref:CLUMA_CG004761, isoform A n=1 Tax=Clunio marinus TaxID=568069 RepID=A0A1J1HY57_9DIPT|nr:CLUMA_CG004761, isoform A [Clunio marinus]
MMMMMRKHHRWIKIVFGNFTGIGACLTMLLRHADVEFLLRKITLSSNFFSTNFWKILIALLCTG